jgi:O-acetyl-ADP-ribose deacetylase (regulator of RNase III)
MLPPLTWGTTAVRIVKGDITEQDVDAVVNAANSTLLGGGGVDGAIHRRGGPKILEECREIRRSSWPDGLPSGKAVITGGGLLKARHVIHAVGPVWRGGRHVEAQALAGCYQNSLEIVKERGLRSVAFPAISAGAYGYPIEEAGAVALRTVKEFVEREGWPPAVAFVLFNGRDLAVYERLASGLRPSQ